MKKKDKQLLIRISEEDLLCLKVLAYSCGKDVSSYLRMMIDTAIRPTKDKFIKGDLRYEDVKTFLDYKLQQRKFLKK